MKQIITVDLDNLDEWQVRTIARTYLGCAGEETRKRFLDGLSTVKHTPLKDLFYGKDVDISYAIDISDEYGIGAFFVYAWVAEGYGIFYIGCGNESRVTDTAGRKDDFKKMIESKNCKPYIICAYSRKDFALEVEAACIHHAQMSGVRLLNKNGLLDEKQAFLYQLSSKPNMEEIEETIDEKSEYFVYKDEKWDKQDYLTALDKIIVDGVTVKIERKEKPKDNPYEKKKIFWTAFGERKPASEWCKQYHISSNTVKSRMERHGLTMEQALTFPQVPCGRRGIMHKAEDYWRECGLLG